MLASEGVKPVVKDLLIDTYEDMGVKDADRYFTKAEPLPMPGAVPGQPPVPGQEGVLGQPTPQGAPQQPPQQPVANQQPMV